MIELQLGTDIRKPTFMIIIFTLRYGFLNNGKGNIVDEVVYNVTYKSSVFINRILRSI